MSIYTKRGDEGYSSIYGTDERIKKSGKIFDVLGTLDELNAVIGFAASSRIKSICSIATRLQSDLLNLGSVIAKHDVTQDQLEIWDKKVTELENDIDSMESRMPELHSFILPGGSLEACYLHMARTISRRLERTFIDYVTFENKENLLVLEKYINRISDLLFILARYANFVLGIDDIHWSNDRMN